MSSIPEKAGFTKFVEFWFLVVGLWFLILEVVMNPRSAITS